MFSLIAHMVAARQRSNNQRATKGGIARTNGGLYRTTASTEALQEEHGDEAGGQIVFVVQRAATVHISALTHCPERRMAPFGDIAFATAPGNAASSRPGPQSNLVGIASEWREWRRPATRGMASKGFVALESRSPDIG